MSLPSSAPMPATPAAAVAPPLNGRAECHTDLQPSPGALRTPRAPLALEATLDALARCAAAAAQCPIAVIALADDRNGQLHFMARHGWDVAGMALQEALCRHAMAQGRLFEVPDTWTLALGEFAGEALALHRHGLRQYAGVPLVLDGRPRGTLFVAHTEPHRLSPAQRQVLQELAGAAAHALAAHRALAHDLHLLGHDLRTPLNSVLGFTRLLLDGGAARPAREREWLGLIEKAGQQLLSMLGALAPRSR